MKEKSYISCDNCGMYDLKEKFPDKDTNRGRETLRKFGWDLDNPSHIGQIQTMYAGAVCYGCGNFSSLDFNPDRKSLELAVQ
jgi:hypothetical protein